MMLYEYSIKIAVIFLALLLSANLNGSSTWSGGQVGNLGSGHLSQWENHNISIEYEQIEIEMCNGYARISSEYHLKNKGCPVATRCSFPFVIYSNGYNHRYERKNSYIENYSIKEIGKTSARNTGVKKWETSALISGFDHISRKKVPSGATNNTKLDYSFVKGDRITWLPIAQSKRQPHIRYGWNYSDLNFGELELKKIRVEYTVFYSYSVSKITGDTVYGPEFLRYFMFTGATWKGAIKAGKVVIKTTSTTGNRLDISPRKNFTRVGNDYVWEFKNYHPAVSDNITINLNNRNQSIFVPNKSHTALDFYLKIRNQAYSVSSADTVFASSGLYKKKSIPVHDFDKRTAWFPQSKGDGNGEYIEMRFTQKRRIDKIAIIPGNARSYKAYYAHNRIKILSVVINGKYYKKVILPDYHGTYSIDQYQLYHYISLQKYPQKISRIKLVIADVYRGTSHNKSCISEILLLKKIKRMPNPHLR